MLLEKQGTPTFWSADGHPVTVASWRADCATGDVRPGTPLPPAGAGCQLTALYDDAIISPPLHPPTPSPAAASRPVVALALGLILFEVLI